MRYLIFLITVLFPFFLIAEDTDQNAGVDNDSWTVADAGISSKTFESRYQEGRKAANSGRFKDAKKIWQELHKQGHAQSTYQLGRLYARGDGVQRNFGIGRRYFKEAAEKGHADANFALGLMYLRGDGVDMDRDTARTYLKKADELGSPKAGKYLR